MSDKIIAEKKEIRSIFSADFWFLIPEYQRSYVWDKDNIGDLLDDLWFAFKNKPENEYFLGSLVLKKTNEKEFNEFEVLDGQQRLTTFFILFAVLRDITNNSGLKRTCHKRIYQEQEEFDGIPARIRLVYKIRDNVEAFIKDFILEKNGTKKNDLKEWQNSKNVSISHMVIAVKTITSFLHAKSPDEINKFGKYIGFKPVFIYVSTENREDAFRMFTILNDRGVPLTNADILKATNLGKITDEKEQNKYAEKWEVIEGDLGSDFNRFLAFIRTIFVKEKARVSLLEEFEENIYKKSLLKKGKETIEYIAKTKESYDIIVRLINGDFLENGYKNLLTIMDIGLPSGDWIPPLLLFYEKFGNAELFSFLKKLEFKFSSDWILQFTPTQRIDNMNKILKAISKSFSSESVLNEKSLFSVEKDALGKILDERVYGRRFARYILLKYEYLLGDNTVHLSSYKTISVEHVLPQNPSDNSDWKQLFTDENKELWKHRLANLVLINKRKNTKLSNLDFIEKRNRYLKGRISVFPSGKIFLNYNEWNTQVLEDRQSEMINKLTG